MKRRSIRRVLVVAFAAVALGAVAVSSGVAFVLLRLAREESTLVELGRDVEVFGDLRRQNPRRTLAGQGVFFFPSVPPELGSNTQGKAVFEGREVLYAYGPATLNRRTGFLVALRPVSDLPGLPGGVATPMVAAGLAAVVSGWAAAYVLSGRISRPLRGLTDYVSGRSAGTVPARHDPVEVDDLRLEFETLRESLDEARSRENEFLMSVSHELRTPLTAIRGYAEALADDAGADPIVAGGIIQSESRRLERLVSDLLDLSRLTSDEFPVDLIDADLASVASGVVKSMKPAASGAGVRLSADGASVSVRTDPDRVHQILTNLVENALRVVPEGSEVKISVADHRIEVIDFGPGIEPADIEHVFERFYLWDKYRGERKAGTGLGLAITGRLAAILNVKISVSSAAGVGTSFLLEF